MMYKKILLLTLIAVSTTSFAANTSQPLTNTGPMPTAANITQTSTQQPISEPTTNNSSIPGFYIGIGAGYGRMNTPHLKDANAWDSPTIIFRSSWQVIGGLAGRIYAGYLWAIPGTEDLQAGIEAGYNIYTPSIYTVTWLGGVANTTWHYSGHYIDVLGVAKFKAPNSGLNFLLKAGAAYVSQTFHLSRNIDYFWPYSYEQKTATAWLPKAAIAIGYDFTQNFGMDLTVAHVFGSNPAELKDKQTLDKSTSKVASVTTVLVDITYHL